jgi:hypothetical protein
MNKKLKTFLLVNALFAACALLLMPFLYLTRESKLLGGLFTCLTHDLFSIYCPTCGFTRAFTLMLRFDLVGALRANPMAVVLAAGVIYFDARALISIIRKEERILHLRLRHFFVYVALLLAFCLVRNILLIKYHIDPLGDFL